MTAHTLAAPQHRDRRTWPMAMLALTILTVLALGVLAALDMGMAHAATVTGYNPDCTGGPGCAQGAKLASWFGGLALFACVAIVVAGAVMFGLGRGGHSSVMQNAGAGMILAGLVGGYFVNDAAGVVNWGIGL